MEIMTYQMKNVLWIEVPEEVDQCIADRIRRKCDIILLDQRCRHVVFDFTKTIFMDSAGIGMMMGRYRQIHMREGKVFAYRPGKRMVKLMEMAGLFRYIEIGQTMSQIDKKLEEKA